MFAYPGRHFPTISYNPIAHGFNRGLCDGMIFFESWIISQKTHGWNRGLCDGMIFFESWAPGIPIITQGWNRGLFIQTHYRRRINHLSETRANNHSPLRTPSKTMGSVAWPSAGRISPKPGRIMIRPYGLSSITKSVHPVFCWGWPFGPRGSGTWSARYFLRLQGPKQRINR